MGARRRPCKYHTSAGSVSAVSDVHPAAMAGERLGVAVGEFLLTELRKLLSHSNVNYNHLVTDQTSWLR